MHLNCWTHRPLVRNHESFTLILYSSYHLQPSSHCLGLSAFAKSGNNGIWPMPWTLLNTLPSDSWSTSCICLKAFQVLHNYSTIWPSYSLLWGLTSGSFNSRHSCSYCQQASVWTYIFTESWQQADLRKFLWCTYIGHFSFWKTKQRELPVSSSRGFSGTLTGYFLWLLQAPLCLNWQTENLTLQGYQEKLAPSAGIKFSQSAINRCLLFDCS